MRHITQKLQEADYFLSGMKHYSKALLANVRFGDSVFMPQHFPLTRTFQYHFSAMLSAWQCVANYMREECSQRPDARKWYGAHKQSTLLAAFNHLRDSDIHDETLSLAMLHTVHMGPQGSTERNFTLDVRALREVKQFRSRADLVEALTGRPILNLAEDALAALRDVVEDGRAKGYLS